MRTLIAAVKRASSCAPASTLRLAAGNAAHRFGASRHFVVSELKLRPTPIPALERALKPAVSTVFWTMLRWLWMGVCASSVRVCGCREILLQGSWPDPQTLHSGVLQLISRQISHGVGLLARWTCRNYMYSTFPNLLQSAPSIRRTNTQKTTGHFKRPLCL